MARRRSKVLTEVELEFMQVLWELGEVTTEQLMEWFAGRGRRISDGSIRKVLSILVRKGHAVRRPDGRAFRYRALVAREKASKSLLADLLDRAFGGRASLMFASLLDTRRISDVELERIKKLIRESETGHED